MNILYYTSGITGSGHIVQGISIFNALKRNGIDCRYTILHNSGMGFLAECAGVDLREIPFEDEHRLSQDHYADSELYRAIISCKPDVLLVDISWFMIHSFIDTLPCKKIFLCRQIADRAFTVPFPEHPLVFKPEQYELLIKTEPFASSINMIEINPIVIRNRGEILSRQGALAELGMDGSKPVCMFAFNSNPGDFDRIKKTYSYLEDEGYKMVYTTNYDGGLFPAVDYFNAVDLLICGAGYNSFWEAVYFEKDTVFIPIPTHFEDQFKRVNDNSEYSFDDNGADQLAEMIRNL